MVTREGSRAASAEQRSRGLGIKLLPLGTPVELEVIFEVAG
jgi:hypothetical protein